MKKSVPKQQQPDSGDCSAWSSKQLRNFLSAEGIYFSQCEEKEELVAKATSVLRKRGAVVESEDPVVRQAEEVLLRPCDSALGMSLRNDPNLIRAVVNILNSRACETNPAPALPYLQAIIDGDDKAASVGALMQQGASVCGKVFARGEIAYKCLSCGADPTCVICVDCFRASDHEGHDYRMQKTGGGMCDCGDPSAWDAKGFCSRHKGISEDVDATACIPASERPWLEAAVFGCLEAIVASIPFVVKTMHPGPGMVSKRLAQIGEAGDCGKRFLSQMLCATDRGTSGTMIIEQLLMAEANNDVKWRSCWIHVYSMVYAVVPDPWFKPRFAAAIMRQYPTAVKSYCDRKNISAEERLLLRLSVQVLTVPQAVQYITLPCHFQQPGVMGLHRVLATLCERLGERAVRTEAPSLLKAPKFMCRIPARREQEHYFSSNMNILLYDLKYMLATSKDLCWIMMTNRPLLRSFLVVLTTLQLSGFVVRDEKDEHAYDTAVNFSYVLTPILWHVVDALRSGLSKLMAGQPPVNSAVANLDLTRKMTDVLPAESQKPLVQGMLERCNLQDGEAANIDSEASPSDLRALMALVGMFEEVSAFAQQVCDAVLPKKRSAVCSAYSHCNTLTKRDCTPISFHQPLHRLMSLLCTSFTQLFPTHPLDALTKSPLTKNLPRLLEPSLLLRVVGAQVVEGKWRRDYMNILNQHHVYIKIMFSSCLVLDMHGLQMMAAAEDPTNFLALLMDRFLTWPAPDHRITFSEGLHHLLRTVATIVTDRIRVDGCQADLTHRVAHVLALGAKTHSEVMEAFSRFEENFEEEDTKFEAVDAVLRVVADEIPATLNAPKKYRLKRTHWVDINYYRSYWDPQETAKARQTFQDERKRDPSTPPPQPSIRPLPAALRPMLELLNHNFMHTLCASVVIAAANAPATSSVEDPNVMNCLHVALDLLSLALTVDSAGTSTAPSLTGFEKALDLLPTQAFAGRPLLDVLATPISSVKFSNATDMKWSAPMSVEGALRSIGAMASMAEFHIGCNRVAAQLPASDAGQSSQQPQEDATGDAAEDKKRKMKERQAAMMARMKKQQKAAMSHTEDAEESRALDEGEGTAVVESFHDVLATCSKEAVCAFCHAQGSLSMLAAVSTAGVFDHVMFCGHYVHDACLATYRKKTGRKGSAFLRPDEFLCPLCSRIATFTTWWPRDSKNLFVATTPHTEPHTPSDDVTQALFDSISAIRHKAGKAVAMLASHFSQLEFAARTCDAPITTTRVIGAQTLLAEASMSQDPTMCDATDCAREVVLPPPSVTELEWCILLLLTKAKGTGAAADAMVGATPYTVAVWSLVTRLSMQIWHSKDTSFPCVEQDRQVDTCLVAFLKQLVGDDSPLLANQAVLATVEDVLIVELTVLVRQLVVLKLAADGTLLPSQNGFKAGQHAHELSFADVGSLPHVLGSEAPEASIAAYRENLAHLLPILFADGVQTLGQVLDLLLATVPSALVMSIVECAAAPAPDEFVLDSIRITKDGLQWPSGLALDAPQRYDEVAHRTIAMKCAKCRRAPDQPLLCLHCGVVCCLSPMCSNSHTEECTGTVGVFIMIKHSGVIVVNTTVNRYAQLRSPYVDANGETDEGLKRGRPLSLNAHRFAQLRKHFLTGQWDHDTTVLERSVHKSRMLMYGGAGIAADEFEEED